MSTFVSVTVDILSIRPSAAVRWPERWSSLRYGYGWLRRTWHIISRPERVRNRLLRPPPQTYARGISILDGSRTSSRQEDCSSDNASCLVITLWLAIALLCLLIWQFIYPAVPGANCFYSTGGYWRAEYQSFVINFSTNYFEFSRFLGNAWHFSFWLNT